MSRDVQGNSGKIIFAYENCYANDNPWSDFGPYATMHTFISNISLPLSPNPDEVADDLQKNSSEFSGTYPWT